MSIEERADEIRTEGKNTDIDETISMLHDVLYKLNNAVRQQKVAVGIDTFLIAQVILATHTQLDIIFDLLHPSCSRCDQ